MKTLILFLLLASSAWGYEYVGGQKLPTTLTYSCDDPVLSDSFERMFAIWNFACDGIFTVSKVDLGATVEIVLNPNLPGDLIGYTNALGPLTIIQIKSNSLDLDKTMLHEIGHALGMAHTKTLHSIMNPQIKSEASLVQDDVDGVRELYGLSPKVFDFKMSVKGRGFSATSTYGKTNWSASDLWSKNQVKSVRHRFGLGSFEVEMNYRGISVYKNVVIRKAKVE